MRQFIIAIFALGSVLFATSDKFIDNFNKMFVEAAAKARPSVVSIVSETEQSIEMIHPFFGFHDFQFPNRKFKSESLGSGVVWDAEKGYIVTNNHVVEDASEVQVITADEKRLDAEIIGTDPRSDLALLKVDSKELPAISIDESVELEVGEWVMAIGSPFGLNMHNTVTAGVVSAQGRSDVVSRNQYEDFIQHDAAINPGNSGGALIDLHGNLVGINTAIATGGFMKQNAGVGFAIPLKQVMRVVHDLLEFGSVSRGWLGVTIQDLTEDMAKALELDAEQGAIISEVLDDSPADKSGIEDSDVIIAIEGQIVRNASHLKNLVGSFYPDEEKQFTIMRDGRKKVIDVRLGKMPDDLSMAGFSSDGYDIIGLKVSSGKDNKFFGSDKVVVVSAVKAKSPAAKAELKPGDIILKLGGESVSTVTEYKKALSKYNKEDMLLMLIKRDDSRRFITIEIN